MFWGQSGIETVKWLKSWKSLSTSPADGFNIISSSLSLSFSLLLCLSFFFSLTRSFFIFLLLSLFFTLTVSFFLSLSLSFSHFVMISPSLCLLLFMFVPLLKCCSGFACYFFCLFWWCSSVRLSYNLFIKMYPSQPFRFLPDLCQLCTCKS